MNPIRNQFRLRTLLIAAAVIAVAVASLNRLRLNDPDGFHKLASGALVPIAALALRPFGAWIGGGVGHVAHHVLAWFAATLGAAIAILVISALHSPAHILRDIPDGLGAAILICGIAVGTFVELFFFTIKLGGDG